jgi:hypothetical protein
MPVSGTLFTPLVVIPSTRAPSGQLASTLLSRSADRRRCLRQRDSCNLHPSLFRALGRRSGASVRRAVLPWRARRHHPRRMTMQDADRGRRGLLRRARGRTLASPTLRRNVGEAALETDVSRRPVLLDGDAHRDAAGWADRRAVVVGVNGRPVLHAVSLARERNSYLPVPTPPPGELRRTFRPAVLTTRSGRLCCSGILGEGDCGQMQVDIEVEGELDCVLILVAGANQLVESPACASVQECLLKGSQTRGIERGAGVRRQRLRPWRSGSTPTVLRALPNGLVLDCELAVGRSSSCLSSDAGGRAGLGTSRAG